MAQCRRRPWSNICRFTSAKIQSRGVSSTKALLHPTADFATHHGPVKTLSFVRQYWRSMGLVSTYSAKKNHCQACRIFRDKVVRGELEGVHLPDSRLWVSANIYNVLVGVCHEDKYIVGIGASIVCVRIVESFDGRMINSVQSEKKGFRRVSGERITTDTPSPAQLTRQPRTACFGQRQGDCFGTERSVRWCQHPSQRQKSVPSAESCESPLCSVHRYWLAASQLLLLAQERIARLRYRREREQRYACDRTKSARSEKNCSRVPRLA